MTILLTLSLWWVVVVVVMGGGVKSLFMSNPPFVLLG